MRLHAQARRRGFSALEIITVIAIGAVVSIIGFSGLTIFRKQDPVESAAIRFSHALSTARSFAIAQNDFFQVALDLDNRTFWIDRIAAPGPQPETAAPVTEPKVVSPDPLDEDRRVIADGVQQTGSETTVTDGIQFFIFNPDGSANRDARIFFTHIGLDPSVPVNNFTVQLYGPTGHNRVRPRERAELTP